MDKRIASEESIKNEPGSGRNKRKQIVTAAIKVFLKYGFEGASIAKVATSAKVIKATIYSHFKDKKALFRAVIEQLVLEKRVFENEINPDTTSVDEFFEIFAKNMIRANGDPEFRKLFRVVIGDSEQFPEISQMLYETVSCRGNRLIASFIQGHRELNIPDSEAAAQIISGSIAYWMLSQEVMGGKFVQPIESERIIKLLKMLFLDRVIEVDKLP